MTEENKIPWQKVEQPRDEEWDFETNKVLEGVFMEKEENVGKHNSNIYRIVPLTGDKAVVVWGSTVLDTRLKNLVRADFIKIEYLGKTKGANATYKNYDVFHASGNQASEDVLTRATAKDNKPSGDVIDVDGNPLPDDPKSEDTKLEDIPF